MNASPISNALSVVIPVFNNQDSLRPLFARLNIVLKSLDIRYEVIFVNDCSLDESWKTIQCLSGEFECIRSLNLKKNKGQNLAILEGFKLSIGDLILVMDSDLQDQPEVIIDLFSSIRYGCAADTIFVKRIGNYQSNKRMLGSRLFKSFLQIVTGLNRKAGTYFITKRTVINSVINLTDWFEYSCKSGLQRTRYNCIRIF